MKKLLLLPLILVLSLTAKAQTSVITGYINYDSLGLSAPDTFKTWLVTYTLGTTNLAAVDSTMGSGWGHVQYTFNNVSPGSYLVKTQRLNQTVGVAGLMPTYHDSSLYWNTAQNITHSGSGTSHADIWMKTGIVTSGPGFVGGNVTLGANKGAGAGVAGMTIFLLNASNKAIRNTYTDANGAFSFSNLPVGTYSIYPESMGYATTPATSLTVSTGNTQLTGVNFHQDNSQKNIKPFGLSIGGANVINNTLNIYPNPASKTVTVSFNSTSTNGAHLVITNTMGQVVIDEIANKNGQQTIDINSLTPGAYFIHGTSRLQSTAQKLIVE